MRLRSLTLLLLLGLAGCQTSAPEDEVAPDVYAFQNLRRNMPYSEARAVLEFGGWKGQAYPAATAAERCRGREECVVYPETEICAGPGVSTCRFGFVGPDGRRLALTAAGASPGQMRLNGWGYVN